MNTSQTKNLTPLQLKWKQTRLTTKPRFNIEDYCFDKQIAFLNDTHPFKTAVCSRRAGKTIACAADLIRTSLSKPNIVCLYITLSRSNAKKILWPELLKICRDYELGGKVNESDLSITFQNESKIYLSGASDKTEVDKFRGLALALCYIDECQSFPSYIESLVDEVISKALFDHAGTLCLTGTPGPVPVGFFYNCANSKEWSHHGWTMFGNPWIEKKSGQTPQFLLQRELTRKGVGEDDPTIQRECFGQWSTDENALVFRYNASTNHYETLPEGVWNYIIGVDLGYDDSDAICVLAWSNHNPSCYLIHEDVASKQGITRLAGKISKLVETYNPDRIVMDTGGLGKKIAEELQMRYALPIVAAEKSRKLEFIELLNDAMRTEHFRANKKSRFASDAMHVEWDMDSTQLKIKDSFHSDICDSVLYAFREAFHWMYKEPIRQPTKETPEWFKKQEEEMEQAAVGALKLKSGEDEWDEVVFD